MTCKDNHFPPIPQINVNAPQIALNFALKLALKLALKEGQKLP
jgi:hypothetical protein